MILYKKHLYPKANLLANESILHVKCSLKNRNYCNKNSISSLDRFVIDESSSDITLSIKSFLIC